MRFDLVGDEKMRKVIATHAKRFPDRARAALFFRGERVMTVSKRDFVPVDDANLKNSGFVEAAKIKLQVFLNYGGPAAPYAIAVHEHLSQHSPRSWKVSERQGAGVRFHPPGRGPKYLERPLMDARRTLLPDLAADLKVDKWRAI